MINLNDKYMINDILETEKNMTVNMAISLNEASCENIYNVFFDIFQNISKECKILFNIAYNKNLYVLEQAENKKITCAKSKLTKELNE